MNHAITGSINAGKTTLALELKKRMNYQIIEVDDIRRHILWDSLRLEHINLRQDLAEFFSLPTLGVHKLINRIDFTNKIFSSAKNLDSYSCMATPVIKNYIREIQGNHSFLVWVFILEEGYDSLCNGKIIDVISPNTLEDRFLKERQAIQNESLLKRMKCPDINYYRGQDIELFIRNYL